MQDTLACGLAGDRGNIDSLGMRLLLCRHFGGHNGGRRASVVCVLVWWLWSSLPRVAVFMMACILHSSSVLAEMTPFPLCSGQPDSVVRAENTDSDWCDKHMFRA